MQILNHHYCFQAIEIMDFAAEQWEEGMREDACKNYHAGKSSGELFNRTNELLLILCSCSISESVGVNSA